MNQMINEEFIAKEIENYYLYEDNLDCWGEGPSIDWICDVDYVHDLCLGFYVGNIKIENHPLLYGEMISIINKMDLEGLCAHIENEADILSYDPWRECCDANFYGI